MNLARRMMETQEHARKDGNNVLLVVDVRLRDVRIDIICKFLVANLFSFKVKIEYGHELGYKIEFKFKFNFASRQIRSGEVEWKPS